MIDLAALKAALEAATKGEWRRQDNPDFAEIWAPGGRQPVALVARAEDADAIVATQPRVMRELIAEMERLRDAMRPFANAVFSDNGDVTLDLSNLRHVHWLAIRRAALAGDRHD